MKKAIFILAILLSLIFVSCKKGHKVQLSSRDEVYAEFDMSIFRGILPDGMTYREMVNIVGEPNEFDDSESSRDERLHKPVYYSQRGKLLVAWSGDSKNEEIGLITFKSFHNTPLLTRDFVYNPEKLGIPLDEEFAVYVDDTLYFIVNQRDGKILRIDYWHVGD